MVTAAVNDPRHHRSFTAPEGCHATENITPTAASWNDCFYWDRPVPRRAIEEGLRRNHRGDKCVLLVEGPCGVGKSRLVREVVRQQPHVSLVTASYDALQRPEPYVALIPALNDFLATQASNTTLHERIRKSLGTNGSILLPLIPNLRKIINPLDRVVEKTKNERTVSNSSTSTTVASEELPSSRQSETDDAPEIKERPTSTKRFPYAFLLFLRALASPEQPIVLLIENAHNIDASSVRILHRIAGDLHQCPGLVLAFTFDAKLFPEKKRTFKMEKTHLELGSSSEHDHVKVELEPLGKPQIKDCLEQFFGGTIDEASVDYLSLHSQGSMFRLSEFTKQMLKKGALARGEANSWSLQIPAVAPDLLPQLSVAASELVKVISCFGGTIRSQLLERLIPDSSALVLEAIEQHMLLKSGTTYRVRHHVLHSAVYHDHMTEEERAKTHFRIGKMLLNTLDFSGLEKDVFMALTHFHFSESLLDSEEDRHTVAQLCLFAGRKAAATSTFRTASLHLGLAIRLLGDKGWKDHYDLTLACHNAAAEMSLLILDHDTTDELIKTVQRNAKHDLDRLQAEATRVYALGMANKQNEAIDLAMGLLGRLGERIPTCFCNLRVLWDTAKISLLMRDKTDAELLSLPPMTEPKKLMCMQILNLLFPHAVIARPNIVPFVTLKALTLTLKYGSSLIAPIAFALYGMAQLHMGDFDKAYRFGWLGMQLFERLGHDEALPRVYLIFYGCIHPLSRPIQEAQGQLLKAYYIGLQTGDYEFACLNANVYLSKMFDSSSCLEKVGKDWIQMRSVMEVHGQKTMMEMMEPMIQIIRRLLGQPTETTVAHAYDAEKAFHGSREKQINNLSITISVHELILCVIMNDFEASRKHVERLGTRFQILHSEDIEVACVFLSVSALELVSRKMFHKRRALQFTKRTIRYLKMLSLRCPANFLHTRLFLEAELAAFQGKEQHAFESYCGAIATSKDNHYMSHAFCTERTARFLAKVHRPKESAEYLAVACRAYEQWGAHAKVRQLEAECKRHRIDLCRVEDAVLT